MSPSVQLAVWCNAAIAAKWGEQPCVLTHSSAVGLAEDLSGIPGSLVKASIERQCRESKQPRPPRSVHYFRPGILADYEQYEARQAAASAPAPNSPPVSTKSPAVVFAEIRKLIRTVDVPGHGPKRYIPRVEVEAMGPDILDAYDAVGGAVGIVNVAPDKLSFLLRDFTQFLEGARAGH